MNTIYIVHISLYMHKSDLSCTVRIHKLVSVDAVVLLLGNIKFSHVSQVKLMDVNVIILCLHNR